MIETRAATPESCIEPRSDYSHLQYARGFLLTDGPHQKPVEHWVRTAIGNITMSFDPRLPFMHAASGEIWVAMLGRAVDLETWKTESNGLAEFLLKARLSGKDHFNSYLDNVAGRYVVFDGDGDSSYAQADATSMRSVFYSTSAVQLVVASHAELVAEVTDAGPTEFSDPQQWRRQHGAYALPGRVTPFADVVFLTPNTELDLVKRTVRRVFPRGPLAQRPVSEVVAIVQPMLTRQLQLLAANGPLWVSLTAGMDSRVTLAAAVPEVPIVAFSYRPHFGRREDTDRDVAVAAELASLVGIDHVIVEVPRDEPDPALQAVMQVNSRRQSSRRVAAACYRDMPADLLHIRSNHYEIGRAFLRAQRSRSGRLTPNVMAKILTKGKSTAPQLVAGFEDFYVGTDFDLLYNYDPYDVFYWEHRMGTWLNAHLAESDIAYDTYTVVNARRIYDLLLSVPTDDRIKAAVFLEIIRSRRADLLEVPINGVLRA